MDRDAIERLIGAVEAGGCNGRVYDALKDLPVEYTAHTMDAYNGSLDAAKALHDAVLPGWTRKVYANDPNLPPEVLLWAPQGLRCALISAADEVESRAWLLAILRALRALSDEGGSPRTPPAR